MGRVYRADWTWWSLHKREAAPSRSWTTTTIRETWTNWTTSRTTREGLGDYSSSSTGTSSPMVLSTTMDYGSISSPAGNAPGLESPSSTQGSKDTSGTNGSNSPSHHSQPTSRTWASISFCSGRSNTFSTNLQMLN